MSTTTQSSSAVDVENQINNERPIENARYTFKTTVDNKNKNVTVALTQEVKQKIQNLVVNCVQWRSDSQFIVDALIYYLNEGDCDTMTAREVIDETEWGSDAYISASVTKKLWEEIDLLTNHTHTPWHSKQSFYICAIRSYQNAEYPAVTQR